MAHDFTFLVRVTIERTQGKFAPRDEMEEAIKEALDGADLGDWTSGEGGEYSISSWESEAYEEPKPAKKPPKAPHTPNHECPGCVARGPHGSVAIMREMAKEELHPDEIERAIKAREDLKNRAICDKCKQPRPLAELRPLGTRGSTVWWCTDCRD
jgi:hypothetical protein